MGALLFDMFGVIARLQSDESKAELVALSGLDKERFWSTYWRLRPPYDDGTYDGRGYWKAVETELGTLLDIDAMIEADLRSWSRVDPDMVSYLEELRAAGTRLGLLSNITNELADEYQRIHPWLDVFEVLGLSCRIGHAKPSRGAFEWCVDRFDVAPGEILFIDDTQVNLDAAAEFGLRTHRFAGIVDVRIEIAAHLDR